MTKQKAAAALERCANATEGPWEYELVTSTDSYPDTTPEGKQAANNYNFAAHARTDLPAALADRQRLIEALRPFASTWTFYKASGGDERLAPHHRVAYELLASLGELE